MSKSILISIKPEWAAKILNGEKTIEIRKTMPKCDLPIDVYIYCTKGKTLMRKGANNWFVKDRGYKYDGNYCYYAGFNSKAVAKFRLNECEKIEHDLITKENYLETGDEASFYLCDKGCVQIVDLDNYFEDCEIGYAWHIDNLVIFDEPKKLKDFHKRFYPQYAGFVKNETHYELEPLTKAPQSWCYVEVDYE